MAAVAGKSLLVYGGRNDDGDDTNWIYQLSFENWTWKKLSGIGKPDTARSFCSYTVFEENKLLVHDLFLRLIDSFLEELIIRLINF